MRHEQHVGAVQGQDAGDLGELVVVADDDADLAAADVEDVDLPAALVEQHLVARQVELAPLAEVARRADHAPGCCRRCRAPSRSGRRTRIRRYWRAICTRRWTLGPSGTGSARSQVFGVQWPWMTSSGKSTRSALSAAARSHQPAMAFSTRSGSPRKPFMLTAATRVVCMVVPPWVVVNCGPTQDTQAPRARPLRKRKKLILPSGLAARPVSWTGVSRTSTQRRRFAGGKGGWINHRPDSSSGPRPFAGASPCCPPVHEQDSVPLPHHLPPGRRMLDQRQEGLVVAAGIQQQEIDSIVVQDLFPVRPAADDRVVSRPKPHRERSRCARP